MEDVREVIDGVGIGVLVASGYVLLYAACCVR
jgi:hypothetical protein